MTDITPRLHNALQKHLMQEEGFRQYVYKDTVGVSTIGFGRNLQHKGITREEALYLLDNDINYFYEELSKRLPLFKEQNEARQLVLLDMAFNLGIHNFLSFEKMLKAIQRRKYSEAADEMLASKWAKQVGSRAIVLAEYMRTGEF